MKKLSIILVTISIICFVITTSALATNVTLCVAGNTLNLAVQSKGNNGGATIFGVNGWLQSGLLRRSAPRKDIEIEII